MGSGWYLQRYHPPHLAGSDERALAAELVAEFGQGVGHTGIAPGVIGEIGVSPDFTPDERTRAAGGGQGATGARRAAVRAPARVAASRPRGA